MKPAVVGLVVVSVVLWNLLKGALFGLILFVGLFLLAKLVLGS